MDVEDPLIPPGQTLSYEEGAAASATSLPTVVAPGAKVDRYVVLERVGEGGMGIVYAAYDPTLDRRVALKFLRAGRAAPGSVREQRLLREAQAMARLAHPNVAVVYEVRSFHAQIFLALEFVDGVDLRTWLASEPRSSSEILDVFREAGRGLAAAHAANIVHRDFKPENVLIDKQGRPRVTDFGLSRVSHGDTDSVGERALDDDCATTDPLDTRLTKSGAIMGTPVYMSPEQHLGGAVDARSDQFSFCVALYGALYRGHPFAGNTPADLLASINAGRLVTSSATPSPSRKVRQAILRGLSASPDHRFSSMNALLAELSEKPPLQRRALAITGALVLSLVTLGGYAILSADSPQPAGPSCDRGADRLRGVWDPDRQREVRTAFEKSGVAGADRIWNGFSTILDRRATAWSQMYDQSCAATHILGQQSVAVLDLRMECLNRKREEMKTLVDVFMQKPDAAALDRAAEAADKLSHVASCAEIDNLRAIVPVPEDPAIRSSVTRIRHEIGRSRALYEAGRFKQGREYMLALKQRADATGYAPLAAEAANALANHLTFLGEREEAEQVLLEAAMHAVKGRDRALEADTWTTLMANYSRLGRPQESILAGRVAALAVERAGGGDAVKARLMNNLGVISFNSGDMDKARRQFEQAAELWKRSLGADSPRYATAVANIGGALIDLGKPRSGLPALVQSLESRKRILRPDHPDIAYSYHGLGHAYNDLGMFKEAVEAFQAALRIREKELGVDNPETTYTLAALAESEAGLGNYAVALQLFNKTISIQEKVLGPEHILMGSTYLDMGETQRRAGLLTQARRTLQLSIKHNARARAPDHVNTSFALISIGAVDIEERRFDNGLKSCRLAADTQKGKLLDEEPLFNLARLCIGKALIGKREFDKARRELEIALQATDESNTDPRTMAEYRFQLARALGGIAGREDDAQAMARQALEAARRIQGMPDEVTAPIEGWLRTYPVSRTN